MNPRVALIRKKGSLEAVEEILVDENELAQGNGYSSLGVSQVSPDNHLLAFAVDTGGRLFYTIRVAARNSVGTGMKAVSPSRRITSPRHRKGDVTDVWTEKGTEKGTLLIVGHLPLPSVTRTAPIVDISDVLFSAVDPLEAAGGDPAGERDVGGVEAPAATRQDLHRSGQRGLDFLGYLFTPAGLEVAPHAVESCVERVSRLYERGVDLVRTGAYVRRWQRWARGGLRALGEELSERALGLVCRSLGRVGRPHWPLPPLIPAVAGPTVGKASADRGSRHPQSTR